MPKDKPGRFQSRRAASKEALKQMHQILGNQQRYEISSDDDVIEVEVQQPPKKKIKLNNRKSQDANDQDTVVVKSSLESELVLDIVIEELQAPQKALREQLLTESAEIDAKINELIAAPNTDVLEKTTYIKALEVTEHLRELINVATTVPPPGGTGTNPGLVLQQSSAGGSYQLVMDPRLGVIVGAVQTSNSGSTPAPPPLQLYPTKTPNAPNNEKATASPARGRTRTSVMSRNQAATTSTPPPKTQPPKRGTLQVRQNLMKTPTTTATTPTTISKQSGTPKTRASMITPTATFRPTESSIQGGLNTGKKTNDHVDDGRISLPDSREISFNKLQGRTYPSLVVVARPQLRVKELTGDRSKLDVKVKSVLMFQATKFTEWLIQQGLLRSDQKCSVHSNNALKLGMYSDASRFPYSGGYVWISECCPQHFVSVFSGSIFEGSQHPPMIILKLLYHWCCQTVVQNVTQWVKVDNLYVKGMYTWLRSICTVALHSHAKQLGGPGIRVQVGVISLGTTTDGGNKREVKVEILGVLETTTKYIRLRAVEPLSDSEKNYKKRFTKILEPVFNWVHPESIIITDLTVDKQTLHQLGFAHVIQTTSNDYTNSNRTIMDYLRRAVPRMFQNTLSLLSRQIIQQFLDEMVWREWYGTTVLQCFDNMILHLSQQTRSETGQNLIVRLNKVAANPFRNWSVSNNTPSTLVAKTLTETIAPKRVNRQRKTMNVVVPQTTPLPAEISRPAKSTSPDVPEQMVPLENYYYGTIAPQRGDKSKISIRVKCPFCKILFTSNIALMNHLFKHAHNINSYCEICKYCLTIVPTSGDLVKHINTSHPDETKFDNVFVCLICESQYRNPFVLGKHMSKEHGPSELPYLCGTCGYRCSNHRNAIDHFYQAHDQGTTIQCPFCLKATTIFAGGRNMIQNIQYYVNHLQKHQKKQLAKRCDKCILWFIQKEFLKDHQIKMHASQRGKPGLIPSFAPRNGVMVPRSRIDRVPDDDVAINILALHFNVNNSLNCKECDKQFNSPNHFRHFESCVNLNCKYSTYCGAAMQKHMGVCKSMPLRIPANKLPCEMFCVCGYKDIYGNQLARHLAICERKSAYPSPETAKSATVAQSMLDVLGLVRKPGETKRATVNDVKKQESIKKTPVETKKTQKIDAKKSSVDIVEVLDDVKVEDEPISEINLSISEVRGGLDVEEFEAKSEKQTPEKNTKPTEEETKQKDEDVIQIEENSNQNNVEKQTEETKQKDDEDVLQIEENTNQNVEKNTKQTEENEEETKQKDDEDVLQIEENTNQNNVDKNTKPTEEETKQKDDGDVIEIKENTNQSNVEESIENTEDPVTEITEDAVTEITEDAVTEITEDTVTENTEDTVTENTEDTVTENTEDTVTENTIIISDDKCADKEDVEEEASTEDTLTKNTTEISQDEENGGETSIEDTLKALEGSPLHDPEDKVTPVESSIEDTLKALEEDIIEDKEKAVESSIKDTLEALEATLKQANENTKDSSIDDTLNDMEVSENQDTTENNVIEAEISENTEEIVSEIKDLTSEKTSDLNLVADEIVASSVTEAEGQISEGKSIEDVEVPSIEEILQSNESSINNIEKELANSIEEASRGINRIASLAEETIEDMVAKMVQVEKLNHNQIEERMDIDDDANRILQDVCPMDTE